MADKQTYRFRHTEENADVYSPEAGQWVPFRDHIFETDSKEMADWIALLRNPNITLDKRVEPVGTAINPVMDHAPVEGNERVMPEAKPADAGSGTLDVNPDDNPAVDMDDPQRQASPANAPTGSPNDGGPERVRVQGAEQGVAEAEAAGDTPREAAAKERRAERRAAQREERKK